ncbi:MAG: SHD1 domain-containing protein [Rubripirellula sp.]
MNRSHRPLTLFAGLLATATLSASVHAETWSDVSGKFKIEAEYGGVDGKNLVLKKPDGSTINVPINRLSPESRLQAKQLFELAKSSGAPRTSSSAQEKMAPTGSRTEVPVLSASAPIASPGEPLSFTPPQPVSVPPMPAFPENASLQETLGFIEAQLMAGHPEVFYHALPQGIRDAFDSDEMRDELKLMVEEQKAMGTGTEAVLQKVIEVLVTKKEFILNSQMMAMVPPDYMPLLQKGYDPAAGVLYEALAMSSNSDQMASRSPTAWVNAHGPRIGGHLAALLKLAPPEAVDFFGKLEVSESGDSGTITAPSPEGPKVTEMTRYDGRWIPQEMAHKLQENQGSLAEGIVKFSQENREKNKANAAQAQMMIGMVVGMADGALQPLLDANTQAEFDQAVTKLIGMAAMFGGGPGGPGAGPGIGGPPPGF